jgi:hypothetical protein
MRAHGWVSPFLLMRRGRVSSPELPSLFAWIAGIAIGAQSVPRILTEDFAESLVYTWKKLVNSL